MIPVGHIANLINAINMALGMVMAHTLYKSPKKVWQCTLVWLLIFAVCIPMGEVLNVLLPQFTEQRLAAFTGCIFIFGYLYLFQNIPLPQRIFNYFLTVDFMYLILLASRTVAMLLVGYFAVDPDTSFLVSYLVISAGYVLSYFKWFRRGIQRGLAAFQKNFASLTIFSILSYFGSLLLIDVWAPWPALTLYTALPCLGLLAVNTGGYILAFCALAVVGQRITAEADTKMAQMQLTLAEKEYRATLESIDQVRRMRHDMNHHLTAIAALIDKGDNRGAREYIEKASELLPQRAISNENPITDSFVEQYRALCKGKDIAFSAQISYSEAQITNKVHLGILLGNSLQNAYDAAQMVKGEGRFISIEGKRVYDNFILIVKNSFFGKLDAELHSTKGPGHGIGLSSMRNVAEEYGGYLSTEQESDVFTLSAVLTIPTR